jgi:type IV secretion system protein VirB9
MAAVSRTGAAVTATRSTNGKAAPESVVRNGVTEFPFGHSDPLVRCAVLRVCVIELEPGETLADEPIAGDQERWIISRTGAARGRANALVVVKPKACDIATNLVLRTDRRIYDLDLESPPCTSGDTNTKLSYTRHIRFYYPDDTARTGLASDSGTARHESEPANGATATTGQSAATEATTTNRDYRVVRPRRGPFGLFGRKRLDFPWTPTTIADDGAHVYITLPPAARRHAAPVLYALEDDGSRTMLNFTMQDKAIVTDRTFRRGLFVIVSGNREQTLEFENRAWERSARGSRRE